MRRTRFKTARLSLLVFGVVAAAFFAGCTGMRYGHLFAVPGPDSQPLQKSKGAITVKKGVGVAVAAQNEVKEADAFYVLILNQSGQFISFDRSAIRLLDHNGKAYKPLSRQQKNALLGRRFRPKPPIGFSGDVFRSQRQVRITGDRVSPLNPDEVFQSKIMPGGYGSFFVYFPKKSISSRYLTLIVPEIELGGTKEKLTFVYRFEVQEE